MQNTHSSTGQHFLISGTMSDFAFINPLRKFSYDPMPALYECNPLAVIGGQSILLLRSDCSGCPDNCRGTRAAGDNTCRDTPDPFPNSVVKPARPMVVLIGRE
jgi:hypothetical protein